MSIILFDNNNHRWVKFNDLTESGEVQSNQFLITNNRKGLLIDCGGYQIFKGLLAAVSAYFPPPSLEYIFLSHQDPDIGSGINLWLPTGKATILISELWMRFISAFCVQGLSDKRTKTIPDSGMKISLGEAELWAVPGHFLHSPGNFHLYDPQSKILFTGDLGASIGPVDMVIDSMEKFQNHIQYMAPFHNRYIPSNIGCRKWVEMVSGLEIEIIAPQHGSHMIGKDVVSAFMDWVKTEKTALDDFSDNLYRLPG